MISCGVAGGSGGSVQSGLEGGTALVFFIGGCTYSEIAALRFLSSRVDQGGFVVFEASCVCSAQMRLPRTKF